MLPWLEPGAAFPDTRHALTDPCGLLAAGADLSVDTLIRAYSRGIFPWYSAGEPILWWSPAPRTLLWPNKIHLSTSLKKVLRRDTFEVRINSDFSAVISACANIPRDGQPGTWITPEMQAAYIALHQAGFAESVECYYQGELVGGLYGVRLGGMFFGESMFSRRSNASKVALAHLCRRDGIHLIDCQMETPHLISMGAENVSRERFEAAIQLTING